MWRNSGATADGYVDPDELAMETAEEMIEPFLTQLRESLAAALLKDAQLVFMGIAKGLYEFDQKSETEFKQWVGDIAELMFVNLLYEWKENNQNKKHMNAILNHIVQSGSSTVN